MAIDESLHEARLFGFLDTMLQEHRSSSIVASRSDRLATLLNRRPKGRKTEQVRRTDDPLLRLWRIRPRAASRRPRPR